MSTTKSRLSATLLAAGLFAGIGAGVADAAPAQPASPPAFGLHKVSWWSPGCATWHTSSGSCVGGQEAKNFQKGFNCASRVGRDPIAAAGNAANNTFRKDCLNLKNAK